MKAKDVVGKKIISIHQERTRNNAKETVFDVKWFILDDGTRIIFTVDELPGDYAVDAQTIVPKKCK